MDEALRSLVAQRIGAAIAATRAEAEMSQEDVAHALAIGPQAVSRIERGVVDPTATRLVELSELFHVSTCVFFERERAGQSMPDQAYQFGSMVWHLSAAERSAVLDVVAAAVKAFRPRPDSPADPAEPRNPF